MELTPTQAKACDDVVTWFKGGRDSPQVFRLFGYAGTGKTTLARYIRDLLDVSCTFATFTGKAASVLRSKGVYASTIHSLIYAPANPDRELLKTLKERIANCSSDSLKEILKGELRTANQPRFSLRDVEEVTADLIIIDEVSMVGELIGNDLCSFGKKILVLGDPGQLPPIEGGGFFTKDKPNILLTEIHRQARDNPIINMATLVRQGHRLVKGRYGSSEVIDRRSENKDPKAFDQLIVGTNRTRKGWNTRYRAIFGNTSASPEQGEKIICLRNDHQKGILNGTHWRVAECEDVGWGLKLQIFPWDTTLEETEGDEPLALEAHSFDVELKDLEYYQRAKLQEFDFGYAITCHKSQGSQWNKVYIQDESWIFKENQKQWLYTALTRAAESVVVAV